ncbi:MAG: PEP-CTERM sorting domain-containing protein [Candidatus Acidiferrales bacterium]|jgi:hypothetical protein
MNQLRISTILKACLALTVAFVGLGFAQSASADQLINWTVNANFTYNSQSNTETGSFTYDVTTNTITTWDIVVAGTNTLADFTYTPGDSTQYTVYESFTSNPSYVNFNDSSSPYDYLDLDIAGALTSPATLNLNAGSNGATVYSSIVCRGCGLLNTNDTNTVTGTLVPEPGSLSLLVCGLLGLGMLFAKRRVVLN